MSLSLQMRCECGLIDAERLIESKVFDIDYGRDSLEAIDLTAVLSALAEQGARQVPEKRFCCRLWWLPLRWCERRLHRTWMVCPRCDDWMRIPTSLDGRATAYPVDPKWCRPPT